MRLRPAAVAGRFYPDDPAHLAATVADLLRGAATPPGRPPKALIAPHAGYVYSGAVAASAYAAWRPLAGKVRRLVLLGPAHRVAVRGLAVPSVGAFDTPLGPIPIDRAALAAVGTLPQVVVSDAAHAHEHSLEVHLPFLKAVLGDFALAPFAVGQASDTEVAQVIDRLWGGPETRVVISSDLSHFHDYETARAMDAATVAAIVGLEPQRLSRHTACGRVPIRGLMHLAERRRLSFEALDVRSSGDTAGGRDQVVGYASLAVREAPLSAVMAG